MRFAGEYGEDVINLDEIFHKYFPVLVIFLVFTIFYGLNQPINQYNNGIGNHDGKYYAQMAEQFSYGWTVQTEKPFAGRILMPFIVGKLNAIFNVPVLHTFFIINLILMFVICLLLFDYWRSYLGLVLFLLPFHNPLRWLFFYPVMIDYLFYMLLVLGLIYLSKKDYKALIWVSFFIVLTRETGFIIPLIALRKDWKPLFAGVLAFGLTYLLSTGTGNYTFVNAVASSLDHLTLAHFINSIIIAFGLMIVFVRFNISTDEKVFLMLIALLSVLGGVNTVRFIYWSAPVVILMILNGLNGMNKIVVALLFIPQVYFLRTFEGFYTDLTAFELYGGLQLFRPDYVLLLMMIITASIYFLIRKYYADRLSTM